MIAGAQRLAVKLTKRVLCTLLWWKQWRLLSRLQCIFDLPTQWGLLASTIAKEMVELSEACCDNARRIENQMACLHRNLSPAIISRSRWGVQCLAWWHQFQFFSSYKHGQDACVVQSQYVFLTIIHHGSFKPHAEGYAGGSGGRLMHHYVIEAPLKGYAMTSGTPPGNNRGRPLRTSSPLQYSRRNCFNCLFKTYFLT